jgi:hypothetical protein
MPKPSEPIRPLTREEANRVLPQVRDKLGQLRAIRDQVPRLQAQAEIEEMTGRDSDGAWRSEAKERVEGILNDLKILGKEFHAEVESLEKVGAHLKDLDTGLVDFYGRVDGKTVFLCWKEGEGEVAWYHPVNGSFRDRRPLK